MRRQTSGNRLTGRCAGSLAGAVSLLLALCLIASATPVVYADEPPPTIPHQFYGTVIYDSAAVAEDTLVEAFVTGVKQAQTAVDGEGRYGYDPIFTVPGTSGAEVTFRVGGVLANQTATWQSGKVEELNLTIDEEPAPPVPRYALTMAVAPLDSGTATDLTGGSPYLAETTVSIKAEAAAGYKFVNWTAPEGAGTFASATAAQTTFTMPEEATTVTANFVKAYTLTMAVSPDDSGTATDETGQSPYTTGTVVSIKAVPAAGYRFVNWAATADILFGSDKAAETTLTMPAQNITVTANFVKAYTLTMAVSPDGGGMATDETGQSPYAAGAVVNIKAVPAAGYAFVNWTATAGELGSTTAPSTSFTMPGEAVTVTANFEAVPTVVTHFATDVLRYSAILNMSYTVGKLSSVEVRFAWKTPFDTDWFYTPWMLRTADGNYAELLTGLAARTDYEFKAQLQYGGTVIEGATRQFTTTWLPISGLGCFIATAAYGSPTAEQLDVLREFRDEVLLESTAGTQFVALYYRLSPPVADFVAGNSFVRTLVRELLVDPVVWIVQATGDIWRN
jgi:uncharacterized repeat protein (TIGR02543 family)